MILVHFILLDGEAGRLFGEAGKFSRKLLRPDSSFRNFKADSVSRCLPPIAERLGDVDPPHLLGASKIGGATKVFERAMVRLVAPVAANRVDVSGFKTTATNFIYAFNM